MNAIRLGIDWTPELTLWLTKALVLYPIGELLYPILFRLLGVGIKIVPEFFDTVLHPTIVYLSVRNCEKLLNNISPFIQLLPAWIYLHADTLLSQQPPE